MNNSQVTMAEQVARAVRDFQQQRTGHEPVDDDSAGIAGALVGGFLYSVVRGASVEPFSLASHNWYGWMSIAGMLSTRSMNGKRMLRSDPHNVSSQLKGLEAEWPQGSAAASTP